MIFSAAVNIEIFCDHFWHREMTKTNKCAPFYAFKCNMHHNDYVLSGDLVPVSARGFAPTAKSLQSDFVDGHIEWEEGNE